MAMAEFDRISDGSDWIDWNLWSEGGHPSRSLKRVLSSISMAYTFNHAERSTAETLLQAVWWTPMLKSRRV